MLGMHGTAYANFAVTEADLIIAVGARFDDRVTGRVETFAPQAKIVQIDIDPAEIGKNVAVDLPIVGDLKRVLSELVPVLAPQEHEAWLEQIAEWKRRYPLTYEEQEQGISPQMVVETLSELTRGEAIICTEVGQNQMWAAQFYCSKAALFHYLRGPGPWAGFRQRSGSRSPIRTGRWWISPGTAACK